MNAKRSSTAVLLALFAAVACNEVSRDVERLAPIDEVFEPTEPTKPSKKPKAEDAAAPVALDASAPDADARASPAVTRRGAVFAISDTFATRASHRVGAYFIEERGGVVRVPPKTIGPCVLATFSEEDEAPAEKDISAGAITLSIGTQNVALMPAIGGTYAPRSGAAALWTGGEEVTLDIAGAGVPALNAHAIAPSTLIAISDADAGGADVSRDLSITRTAPLTLRWNGESSGVVVAYFDLAAGSVARTLTCTFDAAAKTGEIPAGAFASFGAGEGTFTLYTKVATPLVSSGWSVAWNMSTTLVTESGDATEGRVTYR